MTKKCIVMALVFVAFSVAGRGTVIAGQSGWEKAEVAAGWTDAAKPAAPAPKAAASKASTSPALAKAASPARPASKAQAPVSPAPVSPASAPSSAAVTPVAERPVAEKAAAEKPADRATPAVAEPAVVRADAGAEAKPAAAAPVKAGTGAEGVVLPKAAEPTAASAPPAEEQARPAGPSPLTVRLGDADFLLGGFMDMTAIMRSTNVGSGIGTSFGSIPFDNAPQGQLSETRMSSQNSRVSLQATSKVGSAAVKGYVESDFLGNAPANLNVTSNANTLRLRLYWAQYTTGRFEILGGQSWSFMTPNRNGVSPMPGDLFFSQNLDTNYQVGLTWARQAQVRMIAHLSKIVAAGVSLENPQQYVGSAVVLPAAFSSAEVDATGNTAAPNPYPDVIGKVAFDPQTGATHQHIEVVGLVRGFKTYNAATATSYSTTAHGAAINVNLEPLKGLHVIGNTFFSDGGGRYIFGLGPDFIVRADGSPSLVGARSSLAGVEYQARPKTMVFGYYGLAKFDQNVASDSTGKPIGYGIVGSTAANGAIDETTVGINQAFFREARYGALQLMVQYSYLTRTPFSVPAGTPSLAKAHMVWASFRYILP
jgi:hypothetical protein